MLIFTIIIVLLAILFLSLHAFCSFCIALPSYLRPKIFWGGIKTYVFICFDLAGYIIWGRAGFDFFKWPGAIIFFIFYLIWGVWWHWRGLKRLAELKLKTEASSELQDGLKDLDEIEREPENE